LGKSVVFSLACAVFLASMWAVPLTPSSDPTRILSSEKLSSFLQSLNLTINYTISDNLLPKCIPFTENNYSDW